MRNYDLDFLKKFSMVLGFLAALTLGLVLFAAYLHTSIPPEISPTAAKRTQARIASVGDVYAGATGAASQAAAATAAAAAAASEVAYGGTLDGSVIFGQLCTGCHTAGIGLAPKMETAAWTARIAQGTQTLHKHAIEGYVGPDGGVMPAKGGNAGLTDEQVAATVDWMVANLK